MLEADNSAKAKEKFKDIKAAINWKVAVTNEYINSVIESKNSEVKVLFSTGLVVPSFVAYLTEKQAKTFADDKRVVSLTEDRAVQMSATWTNSIDPSGQTRSWGIKAMNNPAPSPSNGSATVYVIDTGVEIHADLPGMFPGNQFNANAMSSGMPNSATHNPVGCWPHATHVAGIIGAQNNSFGTVGMLPGVKVVSVATGEMNRRFLNGGFEYVFNSNIGDCSGIFGGQDPNVGLGGYSLASLNQALEFVLVETTYTQKTAIVNLSLNASFGAYTAGSATATLMQAVATPTWRYIDMQPCHASCLNEIPIWYPGSLIVQSAGNNFEPACNRAYNGNASGTPNPSDGIIVVGGLNESEQPVPAGVYEPLSPSGTGGGSNYGVCVEMWAPSTNILSTWTSSPGSRYWNNVGSIPYQLLSGTSMAAPHVVGFAAKLLEQNPLGFSAATLEQAVRAKLVYMDVNDAETIPVYMPRMP